MVTKSDGAKSNTDHQYSDCLPPTARASLRRCPGGLVHSGPVDAVPALDRNDGAARSRHENAHPRVRIPWVATLRVIAAPNPALGCIGALTRHVSRSHT